MNAAVFCVLYLIQRPFRKQERWHWCLIGAAGKFILATAIAFTIMAVSSYISFNWGWPLCAVYVALMADAVADLVLFAVLLLRKDAGRALRLVLSGLFTAALLAYGTINMQVVSPKEHVYTSPKLQQEHRFVFLSDLHYGSAQSAQTVECALAEIAAQAPDFILLGGDITDELTTAEEMQQLYARFQAMDIPVYFIYGNHDRQDNAHYCGGATYSPEELQAVFNSCGIQVLKDEWVYAADDLVILGREDPSAGKARLPVSALAPLPDNAFIVCVDHTPYQDDDIAATGASLQLSGHSHAGQLFPLSLVYRLGVNNIYGDYSIGGTNLFVSPGIAGWCFPFRTEAHCNYEVVTLLPQEE